MPKQHPADAADIAKIAQATHFNVHLRTGPHEKVNRRAKTLAAAIKVADRLGKTAGGRQPMIYAIAADGATVHVPVAMIAQARREAAAAPRRAAGARSGAGQPAKASRPKGRRAEIAESAAKGILPPAPDFSAPTHARFRKKLDAVVEMVKAGDLEGLRAFHINPVSSSPKAIAKYRDLAVIALKAKRGAG
ncbi:hypothetical protein GGR16_002071 [Chelatococcus caeni]|uniref:Uncharacterized protein n=1 Tax=Chelatococcus caeni TaxID=1348468 RepID=A0A840BZ99_9HYPH|nr:hypothetical protein [Chelatococcus caeni]MBB4017042.1 hypothetical protein [Chelatococcus caeni]